MPARRTVFRTPGFAALWAGQTLSQVGFQFSLLAMPVIAVLLLHATDAQLGYLNAAETAAFLAVGLLAGGWVDRWRKRRVMLVADAVRAVVSLLIPIAFLTGTLAIWQLYLVAGVLGVATVFFDVAYQSYVPILLPDDDVGPANGALEASSQVARLAGPGLAGLLLRVLSAPMLILIDAASFAVSALSLATIRDDERPRPAHERRPLRTEIAEGLRFVVTHPVLRSVTATTALSNISSTLLFTLQPILVLRLLEIPPEGMGLALSLSALGGLPASVAAPRIARAIGDGTSLRAMMALALVASALLPAAVWAPRAWALPIVCASGVLMGFAVVTYNVIQVTARQRLCPRALLGRMNASIRFLVWGVMPLAALTAGWLGTSIGTVPTLWVGVGVGLLACLPLWLGPIGRVREFTAQPGRPA